MCRREFALKVLARLARFPGVEKCCEEDQETYAQAIQLLSRVMSDSHLCDGDEDCGFCYWFDDKCQRKDQLTWQMIDSFGSFHKTSYVYDGVPF